MKKILKWFVSLLVVLVILTVLASCYFFNVAQVRGKKAFINTQTMNAKNPLYPYEKGFNQLSKNTMTMTNKGLNQYAWYVPASQPTDKTVIVVHGFSNDKSDMKPYAKLFHDMGYNVLMPDNIAHGKSEGNIIGYGWNDKDNVIKWSQIIAKKNPESQITLFGVSMGAATVMMASGEQMPHQINTIIEDCGYTSVWDELAYQAKEMYHLPAFPLLYEVSAISRIRAGFTYGQASSLKALTKNHLPVLFIHGSDDDFVPTEMVYRNMKATKGPKELYVAKDAKHAKSFQKNPEVYREKIALFLKKYQK